MRTTLNGIRRLKLIWQINIILKVNESKRKELILRFIPRWLSRTALRTCPECELFTISMQRPVRWFPSRFKGSQLQHWAPHVRNLDRTGCCTKVLYNIQAIKDRRVLLDKIRIKTGEFYCFWEDCLLSESFIFAMSQKWTCIRGNGSQLNKKGALCTYETGKNF